MSLGQTKFWKVARSRSSTWNLSAVAAYCKQLHWCSLPNRENVELTRIHRLFGRTCAPLFLAALLPHTSWSLSPAHGVGQYSCRTWTRQNGLPVNGINAIAQTPDGYLWLGTSTGLIRFDGIAFDLADFSRVSQLQNSTVRSLANAKGGGLWVGLDYSAFGFFDGRSFSFRGKPEWGGVSMNVRTIFPARDGTLWLASRQLASRITEDGRYEEILKWTQQFALNLLCAYEDSQGRVWLGSSDQGVYYWKDGKLTEAPDPTLRGALSVTEDHEGNLWFGQRNGVRCYDANFREKPVPALPAEVRVLLTDQHGVVWLGTSSVGVVRYHKNSYEFISQSEGLASAYINALAEDREGSLWIGTSGGLSQLTDVKFPTIAPAEDKDAEYAQAVCSSRRGGVWVGSNAGITHIDAKGTYKTYSEKDGLPRGSVKRVYEATNGDIYFVSGLDLLSILSGEKVTTFHAQTLVVGIAEDEKSVIVSVGGDLFRATKEGLTPYLFSQGQPDFQWILNLASSKDGSIWIASETGIYRIRNGTVLQELGKRELVDPRVQYIHEDNDGIAWAALLNGVARVKGNDVFFINRKSGLFDDNVYAIVPDNLGNLWIDASRGIFRVERDLMNDLVEGKIDHITYTAYDSIDCVDTADKTNNQEHVGCRSLDGKVWFPSAKGVIVIDPANIPINKSRHWLTLTRL